MTITSIRAALAVGLSALVLTGCDALRVITHETTLDPARLEAGNYEIDPTHVSVVFKVDHFGFSNYVGRFNDARAALDYNAADPAASSLAVAIGTASVDSRNDLIDAQLRGPAFFDAENHPEATFISSGIVMTGGNSGQVTGDLTVLGRSMPVTLDVTFNGGGKNPLTQVETLGFSATGTFDRSDIGLGAWIPAVGDAVTLDIEVEFVKRAEP